MENNQLDAKKLEILQEQLKVHTEQDKRATMLLKLAMVLTGLLYFMFEKHLFLGDAITWAAYFQEWHSALDFLLMFVIVVMSAVFLAWVKHHAYLHFGLYGSIGLIVFTVIGFALFAEFFSSSASQDTKSRVLLANDAAYQATLAPIATVPAAPLLGGSSEAIARAEQNHARCMANLGKPGYPHCNGDKAKLDSLKAEEAANRQAAKDIAIQSNIATEQLRNERQDKLKADSYNAVIVSMARFLGSLTGTSYTDHIKAATVLTMLLVAVAFEILHHFLSHAKERAQNARYALELELAKYSGLALPEKPDSVLPPTDGGFKQSGIGFTAPIGNTAKLGNAEAVPQHTGQADTVTSAPLFKYQQPHPAAAPEVKKQPFGFIPTRAKLQPEPAADDTGSTYRQAIRDGSAGWQDTPLDAPLHPQARTSSEPQAGGGNNLRPEGSKINPQEKVIQVPDGLYEQWVKAVYAGDCLPSLKGSWSWVQKRIAGTQKVKASATNREIRLVAESFFLRAVKDGHASINPKYTDPKCGLSKYLWSK
ncbi:MAG TPA: hypothetical protein PLE99_00720 [Candidatus Thiothrix moscowensis]|uniref:hypothetical protein n=1 Tax=unclassified Thiothrix TaxID=2636184 RepID=UPI0025DBF4CE|nr:MULTISPECIES: hypothetical protein [unclassified Thiothrix]HRJ51258.1 hypothetical protein [Candidatus Thiothrix moscowensis]HRJ91687.1 hypothetical protein [Candidatus Thiothrix moscowensis]